MVTTVSRPRSARDGQLTDPGSVATATPWTVPPDVIILEPGAQSTPEPSNGGNGGNGGVTPGVCGDTYVVEPNDNPSLIAEKCGVDIDELMRINGIDDPTTLQIGQELILPLEGRTGGELRKFSLKGLDCLA